MSDWRERGLAAAAAEEQDMARLTARLMSMAACAAERLVNAAELRQALRDLADS